MLSMKILVTGAAGQVGRALIGCAPPTAQVFACGHSELDITSERAVKAYVLLHRPDVIVNAAAHTAVDRAEAEPDLARRINADGPRYLAGAAAASAARMIQLSTDFVFDGASSTPYRPDSTTRPLSVYGLSKRAGEESVLGALPEHSVILRTAWVYDASGRNFLTTILRVLQSKGSARVVADQIGTPTAARSVAAAIWQLIEEPAINGIHHWTDAGVASWYDFAVAIREEAEQLQLLPKGTTVIPITTAEYPTAARRPPCSVLDKSSLVASGFVPMHWRTRLRGVLAEIKSA
jgi:dTDP-4-dehydrorhamnose reductase